MPVKETHTCLPYASVGDDTVCLNITIDASKLRAFPRLHVLAASTYCIGDGVTVLTWSNMDSQQQNFLLLLYIKGQHGILHLSMSTIACVHQEGAPCFLSTPKIQAGLSDCRNGHYK